MILHMFFILLFGLFGGRISDNQIADYLKTQLSEYKRFEFKVVSMPRLLNSRSVDVEFAKDKELKINGSMAYLPVYVKKNGVKTQSFITLKIKLYQNVWVAGKTIRKGTKLDLSGFNLQEVDVAKLRNEPVSGNTDIREYVAKRTIRKGTVLQQNMLDKKNLLGRNQIVTAVKKIGNVEISFNAKTRTGGNKDDIIKIYNYTNGKQYLGKVINENLVQIIE